MPIREFWNEEPDLLWAYRNSYVEKLEIERDKDNYNAWLQGAYIFDAISKSLYNSFGRKDGKRALNYMEKPYDLKKSEKELEQERIFENERKIKERNRQIKEMLLKK